jgi:hypothetical protein
MLMISQARYHAQATSIGSARAKEYQSLVLMTMDLERIKKVATK